MKEKTPVTACSEPDKHGHKSHNRNANKKAYAEVDHGTLVRGMEASYFMPPFDTNRSSTAENKCDFSLQTMNGLRFPFTKKFTSNSDYGPPGACASQLSQIQENEPILRSSSLPCCSQADAGSIVYRSSGRRSDGVLQQQTKVTRPAYFLDDKDENATAIDPTEIDLLLLEDFQLFPSLLQEMVHNNFVTNVEQYEREEEKSNYLRRDHDPSGISSTSEGNDVFCSEESGVCQYSNNARNDEPYNFIEEMSWSELFM